MSALSRILDLDGTSNVTALLGPTNTGKTHRAIERMLAHRTGMIGLPLRLLAREVYDRITAVKGEHAVALVTGEEKRIPADPRYWVCTVEAMPLDRPVAFLAVDEVQLAADRTRGHVFTDRLLHARGLLETMFLGSDTIAPLLQRLVPTARIERHARFSKLTATAPRKLGSMPKRTAVVAFSAEDVYSLAERLRSHHGGTAVVLGALSPRARNAQIAMYQAGEVQHLVATDAIGMGLNMDIDHVAFARLRKFDGRGPRELTHAEVAQIAGRAGRYKRDGTFGPTTELGALDPELVAAVESHAFPPLEMLYWRSVDLDLRSIDGLLTTLSEPPPYGFLLRMRDAEDHTVLEQLAGRPEVRARAQGRDAVELLWQVCSVPDFRKTMTDSHADLLQALYEQLLTSGRLDEDFVAKRIASLDRTEGDIEILMARIAGIRTWTFITHRAGWSKDAPHWQARTRDIEERLSDALHERLTERFVDVRAMAVVQRGPWATLDRGVDAEGVVRMGGERLGRLDGFRFTPEPGLRTSDKILRKAIAQALGTVIEQRVQACVEAPHDAFVLDPQRVMRWQGAPLAQLEPGPHPLEPKLVMLRLELLGAGARERIHRRLEAWVRDLVSRVTEPLEREEVESAAARGLVYRIAQALGAVPRAEVEDALSRLQGPERKALARLDVRIGTETVYVSSLLRPAAMQARALLWGVFRAVDPLPQAPAQAAASVPVEGGASAELWAAMGYRLLGPRAVRVDMLERAAHRLRELAREGTFEAPEALLSWLGCSREELAAVLLAMGYRSAGDGRYVRVRAQRNPRPRRARVQFRG